tara:strand:+ start:77 stop:256 length:180 start_codon:yes stop_codon:yes gene_type:complete
MIFLFWLIFIYLIGCLIFGLYAYEMIEQFDVPYKDTELDKKNRNIKERYALCSLRLLSL